MDASDVMYVHGSQFLLMSVMFWGNGYKKLARTSFIAGLGLILCAFIKLTF